MPIPRDGLKAGSNFCYAAEGDKQKARPNNISVSCGSNRYPKDAHAAFREGISSSYSHRFPGRRIPR